MHPTYALLMFAGWTFLLVVAVFAYRGLRVLGGTAINAWPRGNRNAEDPALITRIADAHANCLENLPIFAVLVLGAVALGKSPAIDSVAPVVFWARVAQSVTHMIGTSKLLVTIRATFWAIQLVAFAIMFADLLL